MKSLFTKKPKLKTILIVLLALAGLGAAVGGSFAAYTSQAYQRGVVRNRDSETVRFTSNYLQTCANNTIETNYAGRTVLFDEKATGDLTIDIYVYNYANGNENLVSQRDITYDMTIEFNGGADTSTYTVKVDDGDSTPVASGAFTKNSEKLSGRVANFHKYTVTFPASDLNKLRITATATPTQGSLSVTNNQMLAAVIAPGVGSTPSPFTCEGRYVYKANSTPNQYDGFNYEVLISSGKAKATLSWNKDVVEIDRFFLQKLGITDDDDIKKILEKGTVSFVMDQLNGTGDYLIPFYIKNKTTVNSLTGWDNMKVNGEDIISFEAEEIEGEEAGETEAP